MIIPSNDIGKNLRQFSCFFKTKSNNNKISKEFRFLRGYFFPNELHFNTSTYVCDYKEI